MKTIFTYSLPARLFAAKAVMIFCFLCFISLQVFSQKNENQNVTAINLSYSTGVYRTTATLTATLTSEGSGISDQTVTFYINSSTELGTATTNANGVATITISLTADGTPTGIPLSAAQHTIRAAYNGDSEYYPSSALAGLTVTDANSDLALTNSTGSYGGSATLSATLTQAGINEPAAGEPVTFSLGSPATNVGTATTDANGVATLTISLTADGTPTGTLLSAGTYNIAAAFAGDDTAYNASNSPTASLTVNAAPFISVSGAPAALNTSAGTASSSTNFNILGPYLTPGNVTVSAPAGFDVSADNSTWSTSGGSITIAETGALSTPIYVRLDAADAANTQDNYSGNIVISGGGAATVNVSVPPSTVSTTINAITAGSAWSNAGAIAYTVTFGAPITGLSAGNFSLTTSGAVSGASISAVSSGTNSYTVTVNTGTGDGTIGLNLANSTGLPVISTTLPFTGGTTNIDKTPPTITVGAPSVSSIVDGAGSVTYSVTYADANFNTSTLSTSDITLDTTGTAGGTLGVTMNSPTSYTITISGITGAGTLGITIAAGTASDLAGNLTPAGGPSATFTVISPVISITGTPLALSTKSGTASEATDIEISGTNLTAGNITVTAPAGFDVSADNETWTGAGGNYTIAETGTLSLRYVFIRLDAADVPGTYSGNVAISGGGATANVSMPASSVSTTINSGTATSAYSNASSITFTVVFGTAITGLSTSNFSLTTTGTISGATVSSVGSGTNSYTVTVNTGTGDGNISLNLANATGLPAITTPLPFRVGTTVVDKTPPTITIGAPSVSTMPDGGGSVTYSVTYADANFKTSSLTFANITLNKTASASGAITSVTGSGTSYTVTVGSISGVGTLGISIAAGTATDQAGNTAPASGLSATFNVVQPIISTTGMPSALSTISGTASSSTSFYVSGSNLAGNITVTAPSGFDVSLDNATWSGSGGSQTITESGGAVSSTPVYIQLDAGDAVNGYSGNVVITSTGATTVDVAVSGAVTTPLISTSGTPSALSTTSGTASSSTRFNVSGTNMEAGILVTPPTGFEVSTDNSSFSSTVTVGSSGTISSTPVYIRLKASDADNTYSGNIVLTSAGATTVDVSMPSSTVTTSLISTSGTPTALSTTSGTASASTSFYVSGSNLTGNITVTAPSGFDVSLDNSTWSSSGGSQTITESGGTVSSTPVYIQLDAGDAVNSYSGNVALTSSGATTVDVAVSGTVTTPLISTSGTPSALSATSGTASVSTSFNVSGANMEAGILVTPPAGFEVSLDNSTFSSTVTVGSSGAISSTPVYIRLSASDADNTYSGNIVLTSAGATTVDVNMPSSTVTTPLISTSGTPSVLSTTSGIASASTSFNVSGSNLTGNITVTAPSGFDVSLDNATWSSSGGSQTITESGGAVSSTPVYIQLDASDAANSYSGNVALTSSGATTVDVAVSGTVTTPLISTSGTPSALSTTSGTASASTSFNVSGANMEAGILVTPPAGFEVSTDNSTFSSTVTVGLSGTISSTPVYIRLLASDADNTYSGNIVLTSNGATTVDVSMPSSTVATPVIYTFDTPAALSTTSGTASSSTSFDVYGLNMEAGILVTPPTGFEVSLNNSTFTNTVTANITGGGNKVYETEVYIRLKASDADNTYSGNIVLTSNGATTVDVSMPSSMVTTPLISTIGTPSALSTTSGTASASTSFYVSGSNLTGNITVTAPSGFDVSLDNATWSSSGGSQTITESGGAVSSTRVYIQLDAGDAVNSYSGNVALTSSGATTVDVAVSGTVTTPLISTSGTPSALTTTSGTASASTSFNVSGANMEAGILVTPPTGFEVSTDNSTFSSTVTVGSSGAISSTPVYIRLLASDADNTYSGNVVLTSAGATTVDVNMPSSTVTTPLISTSGTPTALSTTSGTASSSTSFNVSGANMEAGILVTPPTGFEVSTDNSSFSSTVTVGSSGAISSTAVYIRLSASDADNTYSGNIVLTSAGAATVDVSMPSSTVTTPLISTSGTPSALSTTSGTASASTSFNVSGANMEAGILVTPPTGFEVSLDNSSFSSTVTVGSFGTISSTPVYIRLSASDADNTYSGNIVLTSTGATTVDVAVSGAVTTPLISTSGTPSALSTTSGTASASTSFNVSGANMEAGILVTPPTGFEVSADNSTFSSTVTIGSSGAISSTPVYTRLLASDADNTYSGNIVLTSTGATAVDVSMPSSTVTTPLISTSGTPTALSTTSGTASASTSFNVSGANMEAGILVTPPTGFEVGTDNSTFSSTITIGSSGTISSTPVYIRLSASDADNTYSGNVVLTSAGATTVDVSMPSSTVTTPLISTSGTPSVLSTTSGTASASTSFNVSGTNLVSGNLTVTAPAGFDVSPDNSTWSGSGGNFTIAETGTLSATPVYVRLDAGDAAITYSGNIAISGGGAATVNVSMPSSIVATPFVAISAIAAGGAYSNAGAIQFTVTFGASITGLSTSNFSLTTTGAISGASIASVSSGTNSYTITVNTGTGNGSIGLNLASAAGLTPGISTKLPFTGGTITIDKTPPTITISSPSVSSITDGAGTVTYSVTYADANFNTSTLTASNITLNTTGTASGAIAVSGSGTSYTVTISSIAGSGSLGISIAAGTASDLAGNLAPAAGPSATFTVTSSDATLSSLLTNTGTLSPSFTSGQTTYTESVPNTTTSITVTPTANNTNAKSITVTAGGKTTTVASGSPSPSIPLAVGANVITIKVTAQNGVTTDTYTITVTRAASSNALLASLRLNTCSLSPAFSGSVYNYTSSVSNSMTSITITPTTADPTATIKVNGITILSGATSAAIPLNVGPNTITIVVTAQNGITTDTYTITVTRAASSNAYLASLKVNNGATAIAISPAFAQTTIAYTASVAYATASVTLTPTTADPTATIKVNGTAVTSGTASGPIALTVGSNVISTVVTAQNGTTIQTYKVTITRAAASANAYLSGLKVNNGATAIAISPTFAQTNTAYTASVAYATTSVTITPTTADPTATIKVNGAAVTSGTASGSIVLTVGSNVITTAVTAQNGTTTETYKVTITRAAASTNAYLSGLELNCGKTAIAISPKFSQTTLQYTATVTNSTSSVTVTPTTADVTATVKVNGNTVTSGSPSSAIALVVGANTITTVVTAQSGAVVETYTVTVTRNAPVLADDIVYQPISVTKPEDAPVLADDGVYVHQAVSPNGDGIDDYLYIDNIENYPENRVILVNRSGNTIFDMNRYNNQDRVFDGHSNINKAMQQPGTYFYVLEYKVNGETKRKTGFFIIKY